MYLMLTKAAFVWSKNTIKQYYCETFYFYFNIFQNEISSCDGKAEFSTAIINDIILEIKMHKTTQFCRFYHNLKTKILRLIPNKSLIFKIKNYLSKKKYWCIYASQQHYNVQKESDIKLGICVKNTFNSVITLIRLVKINFKWVLDNEKFA